MKIKLTKREYLGEGYVHYFENDDTGEIVTEECTKQQYDNLSKNKPVNPQMDGHTWQQSVGGTIKVDTPSSLLGLNEYADLGEKLAVVDERGDYKKITKEKVVEDEIEDEELKTAKWQ